MSYDLGVDPVELYTPEAEIVPGVSGNAYSPVMPPVMSTGNSALDSAIISDEALILASTITPSLEGQEYDDIFNRLISNQGGLVGPGGAMINIASPENPVYAIVKNESITITGTDINVYQNAHKIRQETLRMLEYIRLLMQGIKIEEGQILQVKLMNMVNSLATVQGEMVGDPNYNQDDKSLEEAFRNITTILIADATRLEYADMPDNDRMIFEARDMAEMFNNLLFENLTKHNAKESFEKAWSAL
ncbi:MAG: hypothetical protein FWE83_05990 [Oscillospiraceae bacterium]|nr:hypothetical protein [Oscillospiraceae bacterium]